MNEHKDPTEVKKGKKNRKSGGEFELSVRKDLMAKGWIVTKFDNDVIEGELKQAKKSFNPFTKRLGYGNGFPDFICVRARDTDLMHIKDIDFEVQFVEAKSNGYLKPDERYKVQWLKENKKIPVFVAKKARLRGEIIYEEL